MGKPINRLPLMTDVEVATDDLIPIQDVSKPKTRGITIAELIKRVLRAGTITRAMIMASDFTGTTDTNGWALSYNVQGKKVWRKRGVTIAYTWAGNSWTYRSITSLPVGMSDLSGVYMDGVAHCGDAAVTVSLASDGSVVQAATTNQYGGNVTASIAYSITLTEI